MLVDSHSYTPLLLAAVEGNSEAVETLLKNGADLFVQDKDDKSVLYWAAAQNHQNVLKVHKISTYQFYALTFTLDTKCSTIMSHCYSCILQVLLKFPQTFKLFDVCDRSNNSPLHVACKKGYLSIVPDLIEVSNTSLNQYW